MEFIDEIRKMLSFLSVQEKNYVHRHLRSVTGENSYSLEILQSIDDQEIGSDKALRNRLSHIGNWHKARNKFVNYLLSALGHLSRLHLPKQLLSQEIQDLMMLYQLGSHQIASKKCKVLIEKCKQQESYFFLPALLDIRQEISLNRTPLSQQNPITEEIKEEKSRLRAIIDQLEYYKILQLELWEMMQNDTLGDPKLKEKSQRLLEETPVLEPPPLVRESTSLEFYRSLILITLFFYLRRTEEAKHWLDYAYRVFQDNIPMLSEYFMGVAHFYKIGARVHFWLIGDTEATIRWLEDFWQKAEQEIPLSPLNKGYLMESINSGLLAAYATPPHVEVGLQKVEELISFHEDRNQSQITDMLPQTYFNAALIYFLSQQPSKANYYLDSILAMNQRDVRRDIFVFTNMMRLLIAIQLRDIDILENTYRSAHRYLKSVNYLPRAQEAVFTLARRFQRAENSQQQYEALQSFLETVQGFSDDPEEMAALQYIDLRFFAERELEKARQAKA